MLDHIPTHWPWGLSANLIPFTLCGIAIDEETMVTCQGFFRQEMLPYIFRFAKALSTDLMSDLKADAHNR